MRVQIIGRPTGGGVSQQRIRDATVFFNGILMKSDPPRMKECTLTIKLVPGFLDEFRQTAMCDWLDNRSRPDKFSLVLDSDLSHETTLISLAHELTHVKQMALGEKQECIDGITMRWFSVPYNVTEVHYYDLPWEIEAHGREYGLYDRFIQSLRNVDLEPAMIVDSDRMLKSV